MVVVPCERKQLKDFIETHHYSKSINGCRFSYGFLLLYDGEVIGAAFFGGMAMANQWKRFGSSDADVIELRRLCCIDNTPKNTESFFIGKMLKWLKKNTNHSVVVSYADQEYGHSGTIYKASNFEYWGMQKGAKVIVYEDGRTFHDKTIRTKYKGKLKPFAERVKQDLENGLAKYKNTAGKHTFVYFLTKKRK